MFKSFIAAITIFAIAFTSVAGAADAPLDSILDEARRNNPDLLSAQKRWEAARARIPQEKSLENPTLGLGFERIPRNSAQINNTAPDDRQLSISQFLPLFGKLSLKGKIAVVEAQMFAADYKAKELEIINHVKTAYYDLFLNNREIALNQEGMNLIEQVNQIAEIQYTVGKISQSEIYKLHMESARLYNTNRNLQRENTVVMTRLNLLLNRAPDHVLETPLLTETIVDLPQDAQTILSDTINHQPELQTFALAIEKNKYAKSLAKRNFFPDLMTQLTQRGITSGTLGPWDLMLSVSLPLWFWTKERYQVKEAIANLEGAQAAYSAMKNRTLLEITELTARIANAVDKIRLCRDNLAPLLDNVITNSVERFKTSQGDFMPILDNQKMRIENQMDYYRALVDYYKGLADLERLTGGLTATTGEEPK